MNKGSRLTIKPATDKAKADGSPRKPARVEVLRQKRQTPAQAGRAGQGDEETPSRGEPVSKGFGNWAGRWRGWKEMRHRDVKPDRPNMKHRKDARTKK